MLSLVLSGSGIPCVPTFDLSNQDGFAILKPYGKVIVHSRIWFTHEIRDTSQLKLSVNSKTKEMEMARTI